MIDLTHPWMVVRVSDQRWMVTNQDDITAQDQAFSDQSVALGRASRLNELEQLKSAPVELTSPGETSSTSTTGGVKGTKLERHDLIPPEALQALAEHYGKNGGNGTVGKYQSNNWRKGFEWSKSYAALQRHALAWLSGEDIDGPSGSHHMTAVAWHAMALLQWSMEEDKAVFDDRYKGEDSG